MPGRIFVALLAGVLVSVALVRTLCTGGACFAPADVSRAAELMVPSAQASPAPAAAIPPAVPSAQPGSPVGNEMGRIPILEYHLVGETEGRWERERNRFRADLELLYARGYRPIGIGELLDRKIDLPAGTSPVVFTFDDASPSQFRYVESEGRLEIDSTSAIGIWMAFHRRHPEWRNRAVFCTLSGAEAGRSFFGDRGIEGQKTEWRFPKIRWLVDQGFEICAHTLWHANLSQYSDAVVQEQIARNVMAIDSAVPGYRVRAFALPLGAWPKNRELARAGSWRDAKGREVRYAFDAVFLVAGDAVPSPHEPAFNPLRLERIQVTGRALEQQLDRLERLGLRYVSDGDPRRIARPAPPVADGGR